MNEKIYLPCLRGKFGDWIYYTCVMKNSDVAERITFAKQIHKSKNLSELIQRELNDGRGKKIKDYLLSNPERFFNSMIVAVYGGDPEWLDIGITSSRVKEIDIDKIPTDVFNTLGVLSFSGKEKLFALDGQHRLAGIQQAIKENAVLGNDEITVIFIAHKNSTAGMQRSRRLFTVLNKSAKAVSKGEIIALDEDDTMAIVVRRLVENYKLFVGPRISYNATNNLPKNNTESLTTIGNLYDLLDKLFCKILFKNKKEDLTLNRLDEESLTEYYNESVKFFGQLEKSFTQIAEYKNATNVRKVVEKYRTKNGQNMLFRPIGLSIVIELIEKLSKKYSWEEALAISSSIPLSLGKKPYKWVIWHPTKKTIVSRGKNLAVRLLLYMLDEEPSSQKLIEDYANALGKDPINVKLPKKVLPK